MITVGKERGRIEDIRALSASETVTEGAYDDTAHTDFNFDHLMMYVPCIVAWASSARFGREVHTNRNVLYIA